MASALIVLVGPTASGKTELGLEIAKRKNGEIVSADSRQLYRELDAGTAKPRGIWQDRPLGGKAYVVEGIPYHLVDCLDLSETMHAARYAELARAKISEIEKRGVTALLVGGTGFYIKALLDGLDPLPPKNPEIREKLALLAEGNGREWLHERLSEVDPESARRIPQGNIQRIIRALEVYELTGKPISSLWTGPKSGGASVAYFGIQWERSALKERIERRCETMFPVMLEEVRRLVPERYSGREPGFQSLGYPETLRCLAGEINREEALLSMKRSTMDYAKRQATWFRRQAAVRWIDAGTGDPKIWADYIEESLSNALS